MKLYKIVEDEDEDEDEYKDEYEDEDKYEDEDEDEDEDENEDEELIELTEDDGVLPTYMVMEDLLKNDRKRTINDTMQLVQRDYSVIPNISKQRSVID